MSLLIHPERETRNRVSSDILRKTTLASVLLCVEEKFNDQKSSSPVVQLRASERVKRLLWVLESRSSDNDAIQGALLSISDLAKSGEIDKKDVNLALEDISSQLKTSRSNGVKAAAAVALASICTSNVKNQRLIRKYDVITTLVSFLVIAESTSIPIEASRCLRAIVLYNRENQEAVRKAGVLGHIVTLLKSQCTLALKEELCLLGTALIKGKIEGPDLNEKIQTELGGLDGVDVVIKLLVVQEHVGVPRAASIFLLELVRRHSVNQKAICKEENARTLASCLIKHSDADTLYYLCGCVWFVISGIPQKKLHGLTTANIGGAVMRCMQHQELRVRNAAARIIDTLASIRPSGKHTL